jgi:hypothetical protein
MNRARPIVTCVALAGVLAATGCSSSDNGTAASTTSSPTSSSTSATSTSSTAQTQTPPNTKVIRVTITGKQVTPAPGDVDLPLGHTLRLIVTSDHDDELHAHGVNIEKTLKAGQPLTLDLKPTQSGVYEVETHHPPLTLMHIVVR